MFSTPTERITSRFNTIFIHPDKSTIPMTLLQQQQQHEVMNDCHHETTKFIHQQQNLTTFQKNHSIHSSRCRAVFTLFLSSLLLTCLLRSLTLQIMNHHDCHHHHESHPFFNNFTNSISSHSDLTHWMVLAFPSNIPTTSSFSHDMNHVFHFRRKSKQVSSRYIFQNDISLTEPEPDLTEPTYVVPFKQIPFPFLDSYSAVSRQVEQQIELLTNVSVNMAMNDYNDCLRFPWCDKIKFEYRYWNESKSIGSSLTPSPPPEPYYSTMGDLLKKIDQDFNVEMQFRRNELGGILDKVVVLFEIHVYSDISKESCFQFPLDFVNQNLTRKLYMHMKFVGKNPKRNTIDCGFESLFLHSVQNLSFTLQNFHVIDFKMPHGAAAVIDCEITGKFRLAQSYFNALINVTNNGKIEFEGNLVFLSQYRALTPHVTYAYSYRARALVLHNSTIQMANFFIPSQDRVWVVNSQFHMLDSVDIEEPGEVVMLNSFMSCSVGYKLNAYPFLSISYSRFVSIDSMTIDRCNGKSVLRVEQCIDVQVDHLTVTNNYNPQYGGIVHFKNCRNLIVMGSQFKRNVAMESSLIVDSVLSGSITQSDFIENESFTDGGALSYTFPEDRSALTQISSCAFVRNKALGKGGAIRAEKASIDVLFSKFYENSAMSSGGAMYTTSVTYIESTEFSGNVAISGGGGAIYGSNTMALVHSTLRNNSILSKTISLCGKESCEGTGGALFLNVPSVEEEFKMINVTFHNNRAVRGGAIGLNNCTFKELVDVTIFDNQALYAGGGVFYFGFRPYEIPKFRNIYNNVAGTYGHNMASPIKSTQWIYQIKGSQDIYSVEQGVRLYPGQIFSLKPTSADVFGNKIDALTEEFTIKVEDIRIGIYGKSRSLENMYLSVNHSSELSIIPSSFIVNFFETSNVIPLDLIHCPYQYELVPIAYNSDYEFICKDHISIGSIVAIVIASTIASFSIFLSVVIVIVYMSCKVAKKVQYWRKRDQAEKDMEKRLLENQVIYSDEDRQALESSNSISKSKRGFIIGLDQILIDKKIGEGGCGIVYLGKWHQNTVAVKCLRVDSATAHSDDIEKEASLLCRLRHPNVLLFYGIVITHQKHYLVVEYLERGSLEKLITEIRRKEIPTPMDFCTKIGILIDVACGMDYLHSLKPSPIIHRDLKPANILLDANGMAKVCDFGLSRMMTNTCIDTTTMCVGTLFYMAPELLNTEDPSISPAIDVYSFSIIMWEIFFEENPYVYPKTSKLFTVLKKEEGSSSMDNHSSPSSQNGKNRSASSNNYSNQTPVTPFTILSKVMRGERPLIPFSTPDETSMYLEKFMPEYSQTPKNQKTSIMSLELRKSQILSIVNEYIDLMKLCWSGDVQDRPTFKTIHRKLINMKQEMEGLKFTTSTLTNSTPPKRTPPKMEIMNTGHEIELGEGSASSNYHEMPSDHEEI
ncbi:hypothetical protein C9374_003595 [Naegleria lovaniensis]|uniref:Protein kinase domain-containing protein n=1 Tax=Naegleria lovaniensis TaxID=51637 RepID=A0AA88KS34_NAELO|nr:uncharacterized protein C9374_003595 [Naegleria lovaniensis]KAG2393831.1 hypothetical protein C9374_003595 [Naegleria lovaniensis]